MALIPDLPAAGSLSNTDLLVIDTGSATLKVTVANAFASSTGTPTYASGYASVVDAPIVISNRLGLVNIVGNVNPPSTLSTGWQVMMTLPSGFRPSQNISFDCALYQSGNVFLRTVRGEINTSGQVRIYLSSGATDLVRASINVSFFVS